MLKELPAGPGAYFIEPLSYVLIEARMNTDQVKLLFNDIEVILYPEMSLDQAHEVYTIMLDEYVFSIFII